MDDLNAMSLQVFEYLGTLPAVANIEHKSSPGIQQHNLALWEQRNAPKTLPTDLAAFLSISNGLSVKWYTAIKSNHHLVGHFSLNSLQHMRKLEVKLPGTAIPQFALLLDSSATMGDVCLVYRTEDQTEIWLRDLMSNWVFLANTFADYYRLMYGPPLPDALTLPFRIVHLGLIGTKNRRSREDNHLVSSNGAICLCRDDSAKWQSKEPNQKK
ncbi:Aste57867_22426 [Aphanomyces stellatus]|uniref:Aste57867_22426 protein n=1 Tax=Aphanomyces stellatus TaxID=120398 RepID=A0A485LLK0_9STRA|nr:hypothetical protein As57867_022356 [Aphanomyces stellatus]VFT99088.1 Aste57867_22426 [Aphanomyces stellatus]